MQTKTFFAAVTLAAASFAASLVAAPAAMANHIDFFSEGNTQLILTPSTPGGSTNSTVTDANGDSILGNDRFAMIAFVPGPAAGLNIAAQLDVAGGTISYTNDAQTMGTFTLRYGDNATLNLVANNAGPAYQFLRVDVAGLGSSGPIGDSFALNVNAIDTAGNSDAETVTVNSVGEIFLPYAQFTGVDFTSIDTIQFTFVSQNLGAGITLDEITREVVPEPTTVGLIGVAAVGLLARRRRA